VPITGFGYTIYRLREFASAGPGVLKASPAGEGLTEADYDCTDANIIDRGQQFQSDCNNFFSTQRPTRVQSMGSLI